MTYVIIFTILLIAGSGGFLLYKEYKKRHSGVGRREMDLALVALSQQIRRKPNDPVAYVKRGLVRMKKDDIKGAMADFDRGLELDTTNSEARYHRGMAFQRLGDKKAAEKDLHWIMENSEDPLYRTAARNALKNLHAQQGR